MDVSVTLGVLVVVITQLTADTSLLEHGIIMTTMLLVIIKFRVRVSETTRRHIYFFTKETVIHIFKRNLVHYFWLDFHTGSHTDTDFQTLSRQCRAYALQSNGHTDSVIWYAPLKCFFTKNFYWKFCLLVPRCQLKLSAAALNLVKRRCSSSHRGWGRWDESWQVSFHLFLHLIYRPTKLVLNVSISFFSDLSSIIRSLDTPPPSWDNFLMQTVLLWVIRLTKISLSIYWRHFLNRPVTLFGVFCHAGQWLCQTVEINWFF